VLADWRTAPVDPGLRAMLGVLERVTLSPDEVGADDIAAVRAAGVSDAAIEDALAVCACFDVIDRLAEAFDFTPISHALGAAGLLRHEAAFLERGYV
jgi:alkylhydroperoxidase family enzyme